MAAAKDAPKVEPGRVLTKEELDEYVGYLNAHVMLPEKYDTVTVDIGPRGRVYRFATEEELKAAKAEADRSLQMQADAAKQAEDIRAEAIKRVADENNQVVVPEMPGASQTPPAQRP